MENCTEQNDSVSSTSSPPTKKGGREEGREKGVRGREGEREEKRAGGREGGRGWEGKRKEGNLLMRRNLRDM